jgi:Protein of unknown function (DUF3341)
MKPRTPIYGLLAEFQTPEAILQATRRAREAGYKDIDAFAPYPVEGLGEELGLKHTRMPFVVLIAGITGAVVGYFMQHYSMSINYPFNVGGRPTVSWPVFIPITFELLVLVAGFAALIGMLFLNGLPRPHHPLFNVPQFARASQDRFFLCIEATDGRFDRNTTRDFLAGLEPLEVLEVPH